MSTCCKWISKEIVNINTPSGLLNFAGLASTIKSQISGPGVNSFLDTFKVMRRHMTLGSLWATHEFMLGLIPNPSEGTTNLTYFVRIWGEEHHFLQIAWGTRMRSSMRDSSSSSRARMMCRLPMQGLGWVDGIDGHIPAPELACNSWPFCINESKQRINSNSPGEAGGWKHSAQAFPGDGDVQGPVCRKMPLVAPQF